MTREYEGLPDKDDLLTADACDQCHGTRQCQGLICWHCHGSGRRPKRCPHCHGAGTRQGPEHIVLCHYCYGSGYAR